MEGAFQIKNCNNLTDSILPFMCKLEVASLTILNKIRFFQQ